MNFFRRLFGSPSTPTSSRKLTLDEQEGLYQRVSQMAGQHQAKMTQLGREEDEYWEKKKAQLLTEPPVASGEAIEVNHARAKDLATIAVYHFKNDRFDEARKNYERAALLTMDDENLSKEYQAKAKESGLKAKKS